MNISNIPNSKIFISKIPRISPAKKIVFTNGCFDILHLGHLDYLSKAAKLGNHLIVGLNTDNSVTRCTFLNF